MIRRRVLLAVAAMTSATGVLAADAPEPPPPPFRVAVQAQAGGPCKPGDTLEDPAARAYFQQLAQRLERPVQYCAVADPDAASAALASGEVDMAALDRAAFAPIRDQVRALLTARAPGGLTRVPVILATLRSAPPASTGRGAVVFTGSGLSAYDLPRTVLAEQGYAIDREVVAASEEDGLARLRAGQADAVALHVGAWQRQCRGDTPTEDKCKDLRVVWMARQSAPAAFAVRRDLNEQLRFRLLGIHVAMHLENPQAFAWASGQLAAGAENLEPAEALALTTARLR